MTGISKVQLFSSGMEQMGEEKNSHTEPLTDSPFHQEHELSTGVCSSNNPLWLQTPSKASWLFWLQKPDGQNNLNYTDCYPDWSYFSFSD